jgi:DNA-binding MarR family transcriptional regulator
MAASPTAPASTPVQRLTDIIMTLQRCFITRLSQRLAHGQVSFAQYSLLGHVAGGELLSMTELAGRMHHSTAAATGLVDRLENLGYVQRVRSAGDRRKVAVRITAKGAQLVGKIRQDMVGNLEEFMVELSPAQQKCWLEIYEKLLTFCTSHHSQEPTKPSK